MNPFKPIIKPSGKGMTLLFLTAGIILTALGIYTGFFQSKGYEKTTAVITALEENTDIDPDEILYTPTVTYTVNGIQYTEELKANVKESDLGKEIRILYDPADPAKINEDSPGAVIYMLIAGPVLTALSLYSLIRNKNQLDDLQQENTGEPLFGVSRTGTEVRTLYFLTDLGTAKGTCHIEDKDNNILYEAKSIHFSLIADSEMEFTDHTLNRSTRHLIGKTVTSSSDAPWVLDNHSTFTLDGKDIWKTLHENGIRIETGLGGIKWEYIIFRDEKEIARAVSTNKNVHEDKGILSKVPFPGFFRIETCEENLDAVFLTLFAVGRTDMMIYE